MKMQIVILILLLDIVVFTNSKVSAVPVNLFGNMTRGIFKSGVSLFKSTFGPLGLFTNSFNKDCFLCKMLLTYLDTMEYMNVDEESMIEITGNLCIWFSKYPPDVCNGIAKTYGPTIMYVYKMVKHNLTSEDICGFIIDGVCINKTTFLPKFDWNLDLPKQRDQIDLTSKPKPKEMATALRILHFSDTHWDKKYTEGSICNCDAPLCCREKSSKKDKGSQTFYAGKYGDLRGQCDIPLIVLESMLKYAASLQFDLVYWTGDIPPHNSWDQSMKENLQDIQTTYALVRSYFKKHNKVFSCTGNHESYPVDNFPVPMVYKDVQVGALYNKLNECWTNFIPTVNQSTIIRGGYYAFDISPNLRLISLNMNYGNSKNLYLLIESYDPTDQLKWLVQQLDDCEKKKIKVHIIGHVPPGLCTYVWARNYKAILNRYHNTIAAHFYGHTHLDEFQIISDTEDKEPVGVAFIGPSVTTYGQGNPSFRIYTVNTDTMQVEDYETHYLDVDEANASGDDKWNLLYSAKSEYNLTDLSAKTLYNFVNQMSTNGDKFKKFCRKYSRHSKTFQCDDSSKSKILCTLGRDWPGHTRSLHCSGGFEI